MNPFCWSHKQCTFFIHHPRALDLVHHALPSAGIESDTLCIEYFPGRGEMILKSPESPVYSDFIVRFDRLLRDAVESNKSPLHLVNKRDTVVTSRSAKMSQSAPDEGWSVNENDAHGRLILEVAYSQGRDDVAEKCKEYIHGTRGIVRAAIAIKIFYPRSAPDQYTRILHHLDECFVGF
ncbi:hypothetical protein CSOJ01_12031 [Colletotrichum sojae]|uniref:Uncharacterized protein n=1 Tax=Colletotrichum sojae TaxID=2175907 RepID=A0A8H6IWJ5_9PEZI|nr:hypothetical protein CSOJ01_12031 [Colletotrichum sojae]